MKLYNYWIVSADWTSTVISASTSECKEIFTLNFPRDLISFGNYLISGDEATLMLDEESLKIYGNPATIKSEKIEGKAETFIIFPNEAMKMIGNAELNNQGNVINANLITYQILSNE